MIEKHVTSLELSKRLKDLGVKAESCFYWVNSSIDWDPACEWKIVPKDYMSRASLCSAEELGFPAFLSSELGAMLPITQPDESGDYTCNGYFSVTLDEKEGKRIWSSQYDGSGFFESESMADSMAFILIHLIEQGIINTKHRA